MHKFLGSGLVLEKPKKRKKNSRALTKREIEVYELVEIMQPRCLLCGRSYPLQNHHIRGASGRQTYIGNIGRLCSLILGDDSCHGKVESNMKYWKPILIDMVNEIHNLDLPYHYIFKEEQE